jgi:hypothetical protein
MRSRKSKDSNLTEGGGDFVDEVGRISKVVIELCEMITQKGVGFSWEVLEERCKRIRVARV